MNAHLPLPTLLSHALVAFTIEFDNEAEHRLPHRTTRHGATAGSLPRPWLVSMVMWFNCMRFVDDAGVTADKLEELAGTSTNLHGMERWRYVNVTPDPADKRPKPPRSAWLIRPTLGGKMAQDMWSTLFPEIEHRWRQRFDDKEIEELRDALAEIVDQLPPDLPDCLPILSYGLYSKRETKDGKQPPVRGNVARGGESHPDLPLVAFLAKVLLAFALDFEDESDLSLAIDANVLRCMSEGEVAVRDLPRMAGVSKEAIATALSFLTKRGYAIVRAQSGTGRVKVLTLTHKGREAREQYLRLLPAIEKQWQKRYGEKSIQRLRNCLERLIGEASAQRPTLFDGLEPYSDGWRASIRKPEVLPHYPMVLHRGGFPDGS